MLAERDTAQTSAEEVARQWELTAALGTRRTLERDAVANERDTVANECDRLARARDTALEERDRTAEERDGTAHERDAALAELDSAARAATISLEQVEETSARHQLVPSDQEVTLLDLQPPFRDAEDPAVWRARVLSLAALLVAAIVLLVLVLAK
ncbi:MAG: hypothetical protein JWN10_1735 [Solirubrobacterales bacterium]|nr:hypothetical protein [Solirubrobacterales bacterium]